jgi:hypothetical protein
MLTFKAIHEKTVFLLSFEINFVFFYLFSLLRIFVLTPNNSIEPNIEINFFRMKEFITIIKSFLLLLINTRERRKAID